MRSEPRSVCGRVGKSCHLPPRHPSSLKAGQGAERDKAAAIRTRSGAPPLNHLLTAITYLGWSKQVFDLSLLELGYVCGVCMCVRKRVNAQVGI